MVHCKTKPLEMSAGCGVATALVAVNAVVSHQKLGLFLSEWDLIESALSPIGLGKGWRQSIIGRTNAGNRFSMKVWVMRKEVSKEEFPIGKVLVGVINIEFPDSLKNYFEVTFTNRIKVSPVSDHTLWLSWAE